MRGQLHKHALAFVDRSGSAPGTVKVLISATARRSLRYLLAIAGGITLVLVPLTLLSEHSRLQTVRARLEGLLEAGSQRVDTLFLEVAANTGEVLTVPAFNTLTRTASPSAAARAQMGMVFQAQLREYERFSTLGVLSATGEPLVMVRRRAGATPLPDLAAAVGQAQRLGPNQLWLSPVTWHGPGQASL
jgi:hypothetical protein